jgi:hypothetical protein
VVVLQVGDKYDKTSSEVTHQTKAFSPETKTMHVSAGIKGLTPKEKVTGKLRAVDVTDKQGTVIRDQDVLSTDVEAPAEEATVHFQFDHPTAGWPVGSYEITVAVRGQVLETIPVTVK